MTVEGDGGSSGDEYEEVDALDDSDDDFAYEEVELEDDVDDLLDGEDEDFEAASVLCTPWVIQRSARTRR